MVHLKNPHTDTYIREMMLEILPREIARSRRHERNLSLALVSIDHFDELEPQFGKKTAEQVLAHVASRMHLSLRLSDSIISHWAPDQFMICFTECDLRGALSAIERIRTRMCSEPMHVQLHEIPITISTGIACYRKDIKAESLIKEVEHSLSQAKELGENQICHFSNVL